MERKFYLMKTGEKIPWQHNRYGFVMVYCGRNEYGQRVHELRKLSPSQRRSIVLSCLRENRGASIKIHWLAEKLGVSDRTIQNDIRHWEQLGILKKNACYDENGRQTGNSYELLVKASVGTGRHYTLKSLYQMSNPLGYRTWFWDDFKMSNGLSDSEMAYQAELLKDLKEEQKLKHWKYVKKHKREIKVHEDLKM